MNRLAQHLGTTDERTRMKVGLRQSVHRLAAGQGVLMAFTGWRKPRKPCRPLTCASLQRPVSVVRGGAHKDGLCCNR